MKERREKEEENQNTGATKQMRREAEKSMERYAKMSFGWCIAITTAEETGTKEDNEQEDRDREPQPRARQERRGLAEERELLRKRPGGLRGD